MPTNIEILLGSSLAQAKADLARLTPKEITGTAYTLLPDDNGKLLYFTSNTAVSLTVPAVLTSDLGAGFFTSGVQVGNGVVTVLKENANDVLGHTAGGISTEGQWSSFSLSRLFLTGNDVTYHLVGELV